MLYEAIFRPLLFRLDPEEAHERMTGLLETVQGSPSALAAVSWAMGRPVTGLETEVFGLDFPNPIGLAAGFDKDARLVRILPALGFGFLEVGTLTVRPQPGNTKPRIFRVVESSALINRLGFNNGGAELAAKRLAALGRHPSPLGINIGLNADSSHEDAPVEYTQCFKLLEPFGDYFVVNVSSPNTKGLRELQEEQALDRILAAMQAENHRKKPLLVKISPDIADDRFPGLIELVKAKASGAVVSNTTLSREGIPGAYERLEGGLSGPPLRARSTELIRRVFRLTEGKLPIIGVGGVMNGADAFEKIRAGASLVQLYTGLIYRGPAAALRVQSELSELLHRAGLKSVAAAVGSGNAEAAA